MGREYDGGQATTSFARRARPNSPQHLTRPGFGSPAEPAREVKTITAARGLHRATHMQAGRAPRCRSHVGLGRAGERLIR
jgi:hypothetical protein